MYFHRARKIVMGLLFVGTVGGFASGFASMRHCARARQHAYEAHVAKVCADAAKSGDAVDRAAETDDDRFDW